jgi:hypothetical protein
MKRDQRQRLKEIDVMLLSTCLHLQTVLEERARLDQKGTLDFIDGLAATLRPVAEHHRQEKAQQ